MEQHLLGWEIISPAENRDLPVANWSIFVERRNQLHQKGQTRKIPIEIELLDVRTQKKKFKRKSKFPQNVTILRY